MLTGKHRNWAQVLSHSIPFHQRDGHHVVALSFVFCLYTCITGAGIKYNFLTVLFRD